MRPWAPQCGDTLQAPTGNGPTCSEAYVRDGKSCGSPGRAELAVIVDAVKALQEAELPDAGSTTKLDLGGRSGW